MQVNHTELHQHRIQDRNMSNKSAKMASPKQISPLLQPRHGYHGAGLGKGEINIFLEFSKLYGLFQTTENLTSFLLCSPNSEHAGSSATSTHMANDLDPTTDEDQNETGQTDSTHHDGNKQIYKVFELDSNGKPSEEIPYNLNMNTLHLFENLNNLKISFRIEFYKSKEHRLNVNSNIFYCKNLFLKDRKGQFFLAICHEDQVVDLKKLRKDLKAYRNFNFANAEDMRQLLDVEPGGVTPLALMRKESTLVSMVICKSLLNDQSTLMFHPLDSNLAIEITMADLLRFLKHFKQPVTFLQSY